MDTMLIVDDNEIDRNIIANYFAEDFMILEAQSGEECFRILKEYKYNIDIVLLDNWLPDMTGVDILKERKLDQRFADIPVIIVTVNNDSVNLIESFKNGADDYITKPFNILEVKARIKAIMRRVSKRDKNQENEKVIVKGEMKIDCESRRVIIGEKEINLTAKEFDLLELLAMNPGKVYSRENLLNIVWGYEYPGDARTVDVHIRRLREKIETNPSDPKYVYTKWGVGYYFRG